MPRLDGRIALVTGAGRGIGRAIAEALAGEGCKVVVAARSADELQSVVDSITKSSGKAVALQIDLSDRAQTRQLIERAARQAGPVDILVNNAGVGSSGDPRPFVEFRDQFWDLTLEVNLTVPYLLTKLVLPHMLDQGWGRVITVASINGRIPSLHSSAYTASKHGVIGLMRAVALEVASQGVTVNCICPGPVKTLMNDLRIKYDAERLGRDIAEHEQRLTPVGGRLAPEDIAPMAVYLASDAARMVTGQAYNICGGVNMA
jgi:NAD(P)-dependent dehydrogenase (short-subunit alcohol dehydrogenase family)